MSSVRVCTFNAENLFARYQFRSNQSPSDDGGFSINNLAFTLNNEREKNLTGRVIRDVDADIVCLQEVENLPVLKRFASEHLASKNYKHRLLIDGNDPRMIDVAILSRFPIRAIRSHAFERNARNTASLFSRDCLVAEVTVPVDNQGNTAPLFFYINHFKSMMGGREQTRARRQEQASRVAEILTDDFGENMDGNFIVAGDFNDYPGDGTGVSALIDHPQLVNGVERLSTEDRWTHHWAGGNSYSQLDYLLLSKKLDTAAQHPVPERNLKGLPYRAERYDGDRYDGVGETRPKASDHVPLFMDIPLTALT